MFNGKEYTHLNFHSKFMFEALKLAEKAFHEDEIPVGAIVVKGHRIIGKGYNQTEKLSDPTAHAEMIAISAACSSLNEKSLRGCSIYVTLEPCPMCAGAIVLSKADKIVFGASDEKTGSCGTLFNLVNNMKLNHQVEVIQGVLELDCSIPLKEFFRRKR